MHVLFHIHVSCISAYNIYLWKNDTVLQKVAQPLCTTGANITLICLTLNRNRSKKRDVQPSWISHFARTCCICAKRKGLTSSFVCSPQVLPTLYSRFCIFFFFFKPYLSLSLQLAKAHLPTFSIGSSYVLFSRPRAEVWSISLGPELC